MINMAVLQGLGDEVTQNLATLENQSLRAIKAFRSDAPLTSERDAVLAIMQRIQDTLDWAPRTLVSVAATMMDRYQSFPLLNAFSTIFGADPNRPSWLQPEENLNAWKEVVAAYKPLTSAFIAGQRAAVQADGLRLANNVAFWGKVAKYTGIEYMQSVWAKLWEAVDSLRVQRASAKKAIEVSNSVINRSVGVPASLVQKNAEISNQFQVLTSRARTALAPLGSSATQAAGLDGLPLVIAGITAAVVMSITGVIWAVVNEFTSIQRQANTNATDLLRWRDAQDAADFAAGKITEQQLVARRKQSAAAATEISEKQGAGIIGDALKKAGEGVGSSIGTTVVVGLGLYLGVMYFLKKQG